jgi:hypothetical protein
MTGSAAVGWKNGWRGISTEWRRRNRAETVKLIKPVKAWARVNKMHRTIYAYWTFDTKADLTDPETFHRSGATAQICKGDEWREVEIRPVPKKKRSAKRREACK